MKKNRVLQVTGGLDTGGLETVAMNIVRHADREQASFDFLVYGEHPGAYEKEAKETGCHVIHMRKPRNYLSFYKKLESVIRNHGPYDVIIAHTYFSSGIVLKAAKKAGVKVCAAYAHSGKRGSETIIKKLVYMVLRSYINRYSDFRFTCSYDAGRYVFGNNSFSVIKNGIKIEDFIFDRNVREQTRDSLGIKDEYVIGNVGRLSKEKNQVFLVYVLRELLALGIKAKLLLVGEGKEREELERIISENNLTKDAILLGNREDVPNLLFAMDCFLFPSHHEGLGISAIEAQATGLRVICSSTLPKELAITDLVQYKSLDDGAFSWAQTASKVKSPVDREKYNKKVREKGYSVNDCTKDIERIITRRTVLSATQDK